MTLTTRLTLFFGATLAVVLGAFSVSVYALAAEHLNRRCGERLAAAVNTLVAAAEVNTHGVQWEPAERVLDLGQGGSEGGVRWRVTNEHGQVIDQSRGSADGEFWQGLDEPPPVGPNPTVQRDQAGHRWRILHRRLDGLRADPGTRHRRGEYDALVLTAAIPLEPVAATLNRLAGVLAALTLAISLAALVAGRALCRSALRPVGAMADVARSMGAEQIGRRLPVAAAHDELRELGRAFNDLLDRLQESYEHQRLFAGEASHQLRTPLAGLMGQIEVALRRPRSEEEYRRALLSAKQETARLRRIVESLLLLARADAAGAPSTSRDRIQERQALELSSWLVDQLGRWAGHTRRNDLHVQAEGPGWVQADPIALEQIVDNLVDNALKYSRPGTPVRLCVDLAGERVRIHVEDEGCGLDDPDRNRLFEPFYRSAAARRMGVPGAGLGLAVAQRLALVLQGTIEGVGRDGGGSRFTLSLPRAVPKETIAQPREPSEACAASVIG